MRNFRDLRVWQESHALTLAVYRVTKSFPRDELFGMTSQIRRAASSIEANIAEGCGRQGDAELARFLHIALGSASELECHLLLAKDLEYLTPAAHRTLQEHVEDVRRMMTGLLRSLTITGKRRAESGQRILA
jgi:four helix bundle protein